MVGYNLDPEKRQVVLKLMDEKDRIENLIRENYVVLEENNVGLKGSLVDEMGYPRDDIKVYDVRLARYQIIRLQNDHKKVMSLIEKGINRVYEELIERPDIDNDEKMRCLNGYPELKGDETLKNAPFAIITRVEGRSPAASAGFRAKDEIVEFGSINYKNYKDVSQIMRVVSNSINYNIRVVVRRGDVDITLDLIPKPWNKPGLIGCKIQSKVNFHYTPEEY